MEQGLWGLGEVGGASRVMDRMDLPMNPKRSLALNSQTGMQGRPSKVQGGFGD